MKSVLISIQPKWCELIASGKKTIEVRKTAPKLEVPFKCYIYQKKLLKNNKAYSYKTWARNGKVIGEFVCDRIDIYKRGILFRLGHEGTADYHAVWQKELGEYWFTDKAQAEARLKELEENS